MDFVIPLPFIFISNALGSKIVIREKDSEIVVSINNSETRYNKSRIRSILIDKCEDCVIQVYAKLVNIRVLDCENCIICLRDILVRSLEVLFSFGIVIKVEDTVPLIHIEESEYITVAQYSPTSSYYIVGANQTITIYHMENGGVRYGIVYDMVLTDTVIDFGIEGAQTSILRDLMIMA